MIRLILAVVFFLLLVYILYYFGFFVTRADFSILRTCYSLPTRWEGKLVDTSGYMHRNFAIFKKYSALSIEIETSSGTLDFDVKGPDGSPLSPASGSYGQDTSVLIDVDQLQRCSVALKMDRFCGEFHITLQ